MRSSNHSRLLRQPQRDRKSREGPADLRCLLQPLRRVTQRRKVNKKTTSWAEAKKVSIPPPSLTTFVSPDIKATVALDKEDFMDVIRSGVNVRV